MGAKCTSRTSSTDSKINKSLTKEIHEGVGENKLKILLLGTGESGKSTLMKQLSIIYSEGFSKKERINYRDMIRINLFKHMNYLINHCIELGLEIKDKESANIIRNSLNYSEEIIDYIKLLWYDSSIKKAFEKRNLFGKVPDTSNYFFNKIDIIKQETYIPDNSDILNCRIPTTGVNQISFLIDNICWFVVDVGGQRSERRKWIHQFENVSILMYVVAISEFNEVLYESPDVNRLLESFTLFNIITNNEFLIDKPITLILNKLDLFFLKLNSSSSVSSLKLAFPEFLDEIDDPLLFIQNKFLKSIEPFRKINCFSSTFINTEKTKLTINQIHDSIKFN